MSVRYAFQVGVYFNAYKYIWSHFVFMEVFLDVQDIYWYVS